MLWFSSVFVPNCKFSCSIGESIIVNVGVIFVWAHHLPARFQDLLLLKKAWSSCIHWSYFNTDTYHHHLTHHPQQCLPDLPNMCWLVVISPTHPELSHIKSDLRKQGTLNQGWPRVEPHREQQGIQGDCDRVILHLHLPPGKQCGLPSPPSTNLCPHLSPRPSSDPVICPRLYGPEQIEDVNLNG